MKKEQVSKEVERLETENHFLSHQIHELELTLKQKRDYRQSLLEEHNKTKQMDDDPMSEKKYLENTIDFMIVEKNRLTNEYNKIKQRLNLNLSTIDGLFKELGFIKGEIGTLIVQISMLEEEIPLKLKDVEILDDKISTICVNAIQELYDNLIDVENRAKLSYYNNLQKTKTLRSSIQKLLNKL
nr:magnetosome protein Mad24-2 [Desulfobacteraceae bacterium]